MLLLVQQVEHLHCTEPLHPLVNQLARVHYRAGTPPQSAPLLYMQQPWLPPSVLDYAASPRQYREAACRHHDATAFVFSLPAVSSAAAAAAANRGGTREIGQAAST